MLEKGYTELMLETLRRYYDENPHKITARLSTSTPFRWVNC